MHAIVWSIQEKEKDDRKEKEKKDKAEKEKEKKEKVEKEQKKEEEVKQKWKKKSVPVKQEEAGNLSLDMYDMFREFYYNMYTVICKCITVHR